MVKRDLYILMNVIEKMPTNIGMEIEFGDGSAIGCLLVFDSLESLRKLSPNGKYVQIQETVMDVE